jgi:hypothetical protein
MYPDTPYFIMFLCRTPDNFTHHKESAATQWVIRQVMFNPLLKLRFIILLCLMPDDSTH